MTAARAGLRGTVDSILAALGYSAELDADGDWRLDTEAGPFMLVVDRADGALVALQTIRAIEGPLAEEAELMHVLLQLNVEARGAAFGAVTGRDANLLVVCSRVPEDEVSRERVEAMLRDAVALSRRLDELAEAWRP